MLQKYSGAGLGMVVDRRRLQFVGCEAVSEQRKGLKNRTWFSIQNSMQMN